MSQYLVLPSEHVEPGSPREAAPLMLEMRQPCRRHDQRRTFATHRIGEPHPVSRHTEPDVLHHAPAPSPFNCTPPDDAAHSFSRANFPFGRQFIPRTIASSEAQQFAGISAAGRYAEKPARTSRFRALADITR